MTRQKPGDAVNNSGDPPLTAPAELRYAACQSSVSEAPMFVTFRVGRADDADVVLEDTRVSRRQIEITVKAQRRYFVIDCGSTGGTRLHTDEGWPPFTQGYNAAQAETAGRFSVAAALVFLMHIAQGREEAALNNSGQYCLDNLTNRLYEN